MGLSALAYELSSQIEGGTLASLCVVVTLVAHAPLFVAVRGDPPRLAFARGWLVGTFTSAIAYRFVPPVLAAASGEALSASGSWALFAGFVLLRGGLLGVAMGLAAWCAGRGARPTVVAAALIPLLEIAVPSPLPFFFGTGLLGAPMLIQIVDLFGPSSTTLLATLTSAGLASLATDRDRHTSAAAAAALVLAAAYGVGRTAQLDATTSPTSTIALVQPGGTSTRAAPVPNRIPSEVDLVVLPESALPTAVAPEDAEPLSRELFAGLGPQVLLGASLVHRDGTQRNVALFLGPESAARYEKHQLVPIAESWVGYRAGELDEPFVAGHARVLPLICYETLLSGYVAERTLSRRANVLVAITNDTWLEGSPGRELHLQAARLRAIETRRSLVQAGRDGVTAAIDPTGRILARVPSGGGPHVLVAEVPLLDQRSVYARFGVLPFLLLIGALLFGAQRRTR